MTVQPISTPAAAPADSSTTSSQDNSPDDVNENEFLQLLVAQIQYQDPTNPTDSTTFVTQLAQFSSLEQLIAIRSDLDSVTQSGGTTGSTSTTQGGN
ncbi:MAG: flagellar hook capping FlgD N-terminal domain-containing protein [Bryobacteraceae bacterium]|jgi:flagellar basal-body rod modification protein FlgD